MGAYTNKYHIYYMQLGTWKLKNILVTKITVCSTMSIGFYVLLCSTQ